MSQYGRSRAVAFRSLAISFLALPWPLSSTLVPVQAAVSERVPFSVVRFDENPIIHREMAGLIGEAGVNINGPSLIRVPDWVPEPLGRYYLYFAHHEGQYIRLAYADSLAGPWTVHEPGALWLERTACNDIPNEAMINYKHVASPDVHVVEETREIRMYFHCNVFLGGNPDARNQYPQRTLVATSPEGLRFEARPEPLGAPYFRVFRWRDQDYALAMPGIFSRSLDGVTGFEQGPTLFTPEMRHSAVRVQDGRLQVFYTVVGDDPEQILYSEIDLTDDWMSWRASDPVPVLWPEEDWEGAALPGAPSVRGSILQPVRQLRDPALFEEDGQVYLLYSVAGEQGIAIARLDWGAGEAAAGAASSFSPARMMADIQTYYEFGDHRTAHPGDVRTSDWLLEQFRQIGLQTEEHAWSLRQFFLDDSFLEDARGRIEAFPLWLPRATGPAGVRGRLTLMNESTPAAQLVGAVAWIETGEGAAGASAREVLERRAAESGAVAVVFVTNDRGGRGNYVAQNAERSYVDVERPLPALTFGAADAPRLRESLGRDIGVTIIGRMDETASARNVIGRLVRDEAADWIVVSTPSSGWFTCAGERGPGIAILLALAEWAAGGPGGLNYFFVANSGHELDYLGSRLLQDAHRAPPPERTRAWLHLGAQIATPPWQEVDGVYRPMDTVTSGTLQASEPLAPLMRAAFADLPMYTLRTDTQIGEFRDVVEHGYQALGIVGGGNPWFHVPLDDPSTVEPGTLAAVAEATSRTLVAVEALGAGSGSSPPR